MGAGCQEKVPVEMCGGGTSSRGVGDEKVVRKGFELRSEERIRLQLVWGWEMDKSRQRSSMCEGEEASRRRTKANHHTEREGER